MCGRYFINDTEIYPTSQAPVVIDRGGLTTAEATWGFPREKGVIINARGETVAKLPVFKRAFREGRCLIPATGFYEWSNKVKYAFMLQQTPLYMAGIEKETPAGPRFVILTRAAEGIVREYHHRMPVVVPDGRIYDYLRDVEYAEFLAKGSDKPPVLQVRESSGRK